MVNLRFLISSMVVVSAVAVSFSATITYPIDSTTDFPNPERGFFCQTNRGTRAFTSERLQIVRRDSNITVIRVYYNIGNYVTADILPRVVLDSVYNDGITLRQNGAKMIPRFIYNRGGNCDEPPLDRILLHINQLAPALRANADVIAYLEAGFIGMYGEWHHYNCSNPDMNSLDNTESRRKILFRLLDSLPEMMIALRYNFHKRAIFGTETPLGPDSAFCGSRRARTGAINDAFASGADNMGTYQPSTPQLIESQKVYLSNDNRYLPQGGEPEYPSDSRIAGCDSARADLKRMHWDLMNNYYNPSMHTVWRNGGCRSEISRKLGYRIVLLSAVLQDSVRPGSIFGATLRVKNTGYGKIFNPRGCELIFRNNSTRGKFPVKLNIDPRRWCMTDSVVNVQLSALLPADMPEGAYQVYLHLPDTASRLYGRKEFSIRLANTNVWEDSTGYNSLLHTVIISKTTPVIAQTEHRRFSRLNGITTARHGSSVEISITAPGESRVICELFSLSGVLIMRRTAEEKEPGRYTTVWNAPQGSFYAAILRVKSNGKTLGSCLLRI